MSMAVRSRVFAISGIARLEILTSLDQFERDLATSDLND